MYNYIYGLVTDKTSNSIVIEAGGIGYDIAVTSAVNNAVNLGENTKIFTYLNVKEDEMSLYGFIDAVEKQLFLNLISISGIGPKLAITVLSGVTPKDFASSVINGNTAALNKIKGVGKKTAERIIIELRDKLAKEFSADDTVMTTDAALSNIGDEAAQYLMAMGMRRSEANKRVHMVWREGMDAEQTVIAALAVSR